MPQESCYYVDVFAVKKGSIDATLVIENRKVKASCYSMAYRKTMDMLQQNSFVFDNIYFVIKEQPF